MIKKISFVLLTWFVILAFFFLIGEMCFRVFRGNPNPLSEVAQQNSGMLFQPNIVKQNKSSKEGEFDVMYSTNRYGYRGKDFSVPKQKEATRIFVIGDSYTFGVGAEDHETIPSRLEKGWKDKGLNVEVVNAGIGHTGPARHYMNLRDIHIQYEPDMVLFLLDLTDLRDDWYAEYHGIFDENGELLRMDPFYVNGKKDWWISAVRHSAFARYFHDKVLRSFFKMKDLGLKRYMDAKKKGLRAKAVIINSVDIDDDVKFKYDALFFMRGKKFEHVIRRHWARTAKYIKKTRDLLAERNIPMVLVMYPHGIYVGEEEWNEGRKTWGFKQNKLYTDHLPFEIVQEFAQENNIPFINTLDAFKKNNPEKYFYDWDGHMTSLGYATVANVLLDDSFLLMTVDLLGKQ